MAKITRSDSILSRLGGKFQAFVQRNGIREFNSNIYDAIRETGEIMKAHCRIKKSIELTAREQVQSACLACLPGVAQILPLRWMPPGLNEPNYTSLRVIRRVDDRDGDEVRIRASGEKSMRALSERGLPDFGIERQPEVGETADTGLDVSSNSLKHWLTKTFESSEFYRDRIYSQVLTGCHLISLGERRRATSIWMSDTYISRNRIDPTFTD
ncbi:hypothetical protein EAG_12765 [Camponotus floridanus]|uniref:Uncharacterized protein n=1 Tax=Camponotus floridanus TaxID=104421 RepID=E2AZG7_CAMFO|nr:hypothetical protein EAG_12765 [Camponotus floridanus]